MKIEILNGKDQRIVDFILRQIQNSQNDYYYEDMNWEYILENELFDDIEVVVCIESNNVTGISPICNFDEKEFSYLKNHLYTPYAKFESIDEKNIDKMVQFFKKQLPDVFISWDDNYNVLAKYGYVLSNMKFDKGDIYFHFPLYTLKGKENLVLNLIINEESKREILSFESCIKTREELHDEIYGNGSFPNLISYENSGFPNFFGFTYFGHKDIQENFYNQNTVRFILTYAKERKYGVITKKLVGVLKLVQYEKYHCLSYITTHWNYRRMGITKMLYNELNNFLTPNDILVSTDLSADGKKAHLDQVRKSIITKCPMYDNVSKFSDAMYKEQVC